MTTRNSKCDAGESVTRCVLPYSASVDFEVRPAGARHFRVFQVMHTTLTLTKGRLQEGSAWRETRPGRLSKVSICVFSSLLTEVDACSACVGLIIDRLVSFGTAFTPQRCCVHSVIFAFRQAHLPLCDIWEGCRARKSKELIEHSLCSTYKFPRQL